ncbi:MAG: hypothetical protein H7Z43_13945, partial [Clostridia bacterium]|nr:hypothetical protein [Deltaproteobacteria bacterium]
EAPSLKLAERFKHELDAVLTISAKKRPSVIRGIVEKALDAKAASSVVEADKAALYPVQLAATLHALCVIAVVTGLVLDRVDAWRWMLGALVITWLHAVFRFVRAHKSLRPEARSERKGRALIYLLSPVGVVKAADFISKDRLADFHWLGAIQALGTHDQAQQALSTAKRELDHPGNRTWVAEDPTAKAAQNEFRATFATILTPLVEVAVAVSRDEGIVVRCSACGAGYTKVVAVCFDCGAAIPPP